MPKVFGWQHLIYLAIYLVLSALGIFLFIRKAKEERVQNLVIKALGGVLVLLIIWNRISSAVFKENAWRLIPDSICGVMSLGLGISAIFCKRDSVFFHYFCYIGLFGGFVNVVYPYYVSQDENFMLPATISGLLHHGVALDLSILMILCGYFRPSVKKFFAFPLGLCFNLVYGIFLIDALGFDNAMNIFSPLVPNTFLTWYIVFPAVTLVLFLLLYFYERYKKKKLEASKEPKENS